MRTIGKSWRPLAAAVFVSCAAYAQHTLYACASTTKEYVVGAKLAPSGLFRHAERGEWRHAGYNHPWLMAFAADPRQPGALLLAGGNGLIRAADLAQNWTFLTSSDITEARDLDVDANGTIYFAYCAGIRASRDNGKTWRELAGGLRRKYTEAIRVDARRPEVLIAGGEDGVFRSEDSGATWTLAGAAGHQVMRIEVSKQDPCFWLAATERGGLFASRDCGRTFESNGNLGVGRTIYDVAFDPVQRGRVAAAAWGPGVAVSVDGGRSWQLRNSGLPSTEVTSLAFDPDSGGRLFAALRRHGVYVSPDAGATWVKEGLEETHVYRLRFVQEVRR